MIPLKSPGGSNYPYYYKNGELYGVHFGSFFDDEVGLLKLMRAEEEFLSRQFRHLPMWIDFYETRLTDAILTEMIQSMNRLKGRITRLAIVGCSGRDQRRIKQLEKKLGTSIPVPVRYFNDPEEAKTWLVSEA